MYMPIAAWAKLRTFEARYVSTRPIASTAMTEPAPRPVSDCWTYSVMVGPRPSAQAANSRTSIQPVSASISPDFTVPSDCCGAQNAG